MSTRYVFRYNKEHTYGILTANKKYWYESWPTGFLDSNSDINYADLVIFPPDDWQKMEEQGIGKIIEVEVTVKEKE